MIALRWNDFIPIKIYSQNIQYGECINKAVVRCARLSRTVLIFNIVSSIYILITWIFPLCFYSFCNFKWHQLISAFLHLANAIWSIRLRIYGTKTLFSIDLCISSIVLGYNCKCPRFLAKSKCPERLLYCKFTHNWRLSNRMCVLYLK